MATQAQQIAELRTLVAALAARVEVLEKSGSRRDRRDRKAKREAGDRQITDDANLDTPMTITRDPVKRIRRRDGKVVSRVVRPR